MLAEISSLLAKKDILTQSLTVQHAFHSSYMEPFKAAYLRIFNHYDWRKPKIPLISCATYSSHYTNFCSAHFWDVIRQPIYFQSAILNQERQQGAVYLDLGPSGTLATFTKYIINDSKRALPLLTQYGFARETLNSLKCHYSRII